ncbi:MAG TPA: extracellular solute-binding protein [Paenibacillus sp.]|nr:extracellular solute-binding protein [Paenibacillus sp.]
MNRTDRRRLKCIAVWLASSILAMALASCAAPKAEPAEPVTLRVWSWDGSFNAYAAEFMAEHPHIRLVRVAPYGESAGIGFDEAYMARNLEAIEAARPDVLLLFEEEYRRLADGNKLHSLETLIRKESFEASTYSPHLLALLREAGNGELQAISPVFTNEALFYNASLFERYGVPLPRPNMTWEETLELAFSFPAGDGEDAVAGLFAGTSEELFPWRTILRIGASSGLDYIDPASGAVTADTEAWAAIWRSALEGYRTGTILENTKERFIDRFGHEKPFDPSDAYGPFLSGRAAMTLQPPIFARELSRQELPFDWGVVSEPVDPTVGEGVSMQAGNMYAISKTTAHLEEAWTLLTHLSKRIPSVEERWIGELPARTNTSFAEDSVYAPFYEPPPAKYGMSYHHFRTDIPQDFRYGFFRLANDRFLDALEDRATVPEALEALQREATALWLSAGGAEDAP